ncbi:hypothetical protein BDN71DRAFT_1441151 [Pleurotus eryngii]|uniref:Uncharacterized protein n=1 Tax=Pleurotus eryngii TaxID=5323 RepID=A0A9P6DJ75_PLEER|nr:hypothetical protein BDN71DRAFT_1441151 [Pleurotus eryngii]
MTRGSRLPWAQYDNTRSPSCNCVPFIPPSRCHRRSHGLKNDPLLYSQLYRKRLRYGAPETAIKMRREGSLDISYAYRQPQDMERSYYL